jgi:hypothetical protein
LTSKQANAAILTFVTDSFPEWPLRRFESLSFGLLHHKLSVSFPSYTMRINILHLSFSNINSAFQKDSSWPGKVYLVTTCFIPCRVMLVLFIRYNIITFKLTGGFGLAHTGEGSHLLALTFFRSLGAMWLLC